MRKSRFTESQIIKVLKEVEGDRQAGEVCREYGVSDATYYNWKAKYGGMEVADIRRLKDLEEENQRLKRMFADLSLKHEALKDVVEKSFKAGGETGAGGLRQAISQSLPAKGVRDPESELLCVSLPAQAEPGSASDRGNPEHYRGVAWLGLPETLQDTTASWLSVEPQTSPSRVLELRLNKRRKGKRRLPTRRPEPLAVPLVANPCWSVDFMSDTLFDGRRFRTFNVLDDFNREALAIEIDLNLPAMRIIRVLDHVAEQRGYPHKLRCDNDPELVSIALVGWAEDHGMQLDFIQPGKPTQNSYVERFNRTYRDEILDLYVFRSLAEVRDLTRSWLKKYNEERPHDALGDLTPMEYLAVKQGPEISSYAWY